MSFITILPEDSILDFKGKKHTSNIIKIHSVHSCFIKRHYEMYRELIYTDGPLSRLQRQLIAVVVSVINKCYY